MHVSHVVLLLVCTLLHIVLMELEDEQPLEGHADLILFFIFFLSSTRRHTRCLSDWSSDVCSSDLSASKNHSGLCRLQWRLRIFVLSWPFEGVATGLDLSTQIASLASDPEQPLKQVVIGLHLSVRDAPILDRHVGRDCLPAVPTLETRPQGRIVFGPAPRLSVPMVCRAAHTFPGKEGFHPTDRQRGLVAPMTQCVRLNGPVLGKTRMRRPTQLIALVRQLGLGCPGVVVATLQDEYVDILCSELSRDEARGQTATADDYGALFHCRRHDTSLLSAEVLDCLRVLGPWVWFATEVHHISRVCGGKAGIADHLPKHLAVIAAIHRIGKTGLREQWVDEFVEPLAKRNAYVTDLAAGQVA